MSITLLRHATLESITLQQASGVDGQGKPTYGAGTTISGVVRRKDDVIRSTTGQEIIVNATVWLDAAQSPMPTTGDRMTLADGMVGIVMAADKINTLKTGVLDHVKVQLQQE